jgi:hypothetical protein
VISRKPGVLFGLAMLAVTTPGSASAQQQGPADPSITVNGEPLPDMSAMTAGPEIKGVITARSGERMQVTAADGTSTVIFINEATRIKAGSSLFGGSRSRLGAESLLNGLPVTVKTLQAGSVMLASQVSFKGSDLRV